MGKVPPWWVLFHSSTAEGNRGYILRAIFGRATR